MYHANPAQVGTPSPSASAEGSRADLSYTLAVVSILVFGLAIRLLFILSADFPLHDGGLFYAMIRDLQVADFRLPMFASYNSAQIPYAYPPLAFYIAGALDEFTPLDLLDLLRFLPLIFNLGTALVVLSLAHALDFSPPQRLAALGAYLILPEGYRWLIAGGGLTRSLGLMFALLAIRQAYLLYRRGRWRDTVITCVYAAVCVVSHIEMAYFAALTIALLFVYLKPNRRSALQSVIVVSGVLLLSAPWWGTVVARHGVAAYTASLTGNAEGWPLFDRVAVLLRGPSGELLFPLLGMLGLMGVLICVARRDLLLPLWVAVIYFLHPRGPSVKAAIPLALLAAIGLADGFPLLTATDLRRPAYRILLSALLLGMLTFSLFGSVLAAWNLDQPLSAGERQAMTWVRDHVGESDQVLVIPADVWAADRSSEWFPVIAGRRSIATVQGYEFAMNDGFASHIRRSEELRACLFAGSECIGAWAEKYGLRFQYVYVPKRAPVIPAGAGTSDDCCRILRLSLAAAPNYELVFENAGAAVFRRAGVPR